MRRAIYRLSSLPVGLLLALLSFYPLYAGAGIFSFATTYVSKRAAETGGQIGSNLQTIALLEPVLNSTNPGLSRGGGDISIVDDTALLSEAGPSGTLADIPEYASNDGEISIYVVREGDTLSEVAEMFGVSVNTIVWANNISHGSRIAPGETLTILPISGVQHTVRSGDTLKSIAEKYGGDIDEIRNYNNIGESTAIAVGTTITIPDGEVQAPKTTRSSGSQTPEPSYSGYYLRPIAGGAKSQGLHGYNGVDLATYIGAPILAAADGEVIISKAGGWNGGYGSYVVIRHGNGTQTLYAHNLANAVSTGERVAQGEVVGHVGSTGKSTGSHVHFEVRGAKNPF